MDGTWTMPLADHQSTNGSCEAVTAGGSSVESGMSSKLDTSCSSFIVGLYGAGISCFSSLPQSSEENHLCFKMSSGPSFKFPYRLLRSAVKSFLTNAFAFLSKYFGK